MKIVKLREPLDLREIFFTIKKNYGQQVWIVKAGFEAVGILFLVGFLFYNQPFAGLLFSPYIFFYIRKSKKKYTARRKDMIAVEFKDGMQSVVSALTAGYSIENAFKEALNEIELLHGRKTVIYEGFAKITNQISLNITIEQAFDEFAKQCSIEEITNFAEILHYAKRSGGNLISIIKNSSETICEKIDVKREIATIISAKKLEQNIMNYVPIGIILYLRLTSADMFNRLYSNKFGIVIMTCCVGIYFAARMIADKIVDIKV